MLFRSEQLPEGSKEKQVKQQGEKYGDCFLPLGTPRSQQSYDQGKTQTHYQCHISYLGKGKGLMIGYPLMCEKIKQE